MMILDAEMASEPEAKIVEAQFKVRVKGIDYDVEEQDVIDEFDMLDDPTDEEIEAEARQAVSESKFIKKVSYHFYNENN